MKSFYLVISLIVAIPVTALALTNNVRPGANIMHVRPDSAAYHAEIEQLQNTQQAKRQMRQFWQWDDSDDSYLLHKHYRYRDSRRGTLRPNTANQPYSRHHADLTNREDIDFGTLPGSYSQYKRFFLTHNRAANVYEGTPSEYLNLGTTKSERNRVRFQYQQTSPYRNFRR